MTTLAAEDVRKSYGDVEALRGVSLAVEAGEVFALVGPNGAGKTTLVRCLTGTTDPDGGASTLFDEPPVGVEKSRLGLLPQDFDPPARLTARELLSYYGKLYDDARPVDAVLSDVGVAGVADRWYEDLSGGERRRVAVGTAIVNDPAVLFLDEPTTGIDPAGRRDVWALIEAFADAGTTVFLTTHYMEEAERLADRVGVLDDGVLAAVGTPSSLIDAHGGRRRLVVETDARPEIEGYAVEPTDRGIVVEGIDPREIGDVVAALEEQGVEYGSLGWREPDLETVYMSLVGESPSGGASA